MEKSAPPGSIPTGNQHTGAHHVAARRVLVNRFPQAKILGFFIVRWVPETTDFSAFFETPDDEQKARCTADRVTC
jgi:hypothetical protein